MEKDIKGLYFGVLDYGFISLVDVMGGDKEIEDAARVSYGSTIRKTSQTNGLIRYLRRMRHTSPFEMCELKFHACAPLFVINQWFRHRTASTNSYSGRFSLMPMMFYTPSAEQFKKQSKSNKQGRDETIEESKYKAAVEGWNNGRKETQKLYEELVGSDLARELARIDLPLSTYSQFYWKIDLHNLFHFLGLRLEEHAQWEIREYAKIMAAMVKIVAPLSFQAWLDYEFYGAKFSIMEIDVIRRFISRTYYNDNPERLISVNDSVSIKELNDSYELSDREINELFSKLEPKDISNFELDLSLAKTAEFFAKKLATAVPKIDANFKIE